MINNDTFDLDLARTSVKVGTALRDLIQSLSGDDFSQLERISNVITDLESLKDSEGEFPNHFRDFFYFSLKVLQSDFQCASFALAGDDKLIIEKAKLERLYSEFKQQAVKNFSTQLNAEDLEKMGHSAPLGRDELITMIQSYPFPISYYSRRKENNLKHKLKTKSGEKSQNVNSMLRIIAHLDNTPLVAVTRLQPQTMYSLKFEIKGVGWPMASSKLKLDFITTCPDTQYSVSSFEANRPAIGEEDEFQISISGTIQFNSHQSVLSENIAFALRAALNSESGFKPVPTIGTNQLYFRVVSKDASLIASGYKRLDQHVANLLDQFIGTPTESEFLNLIPVLEAITNLLGVYTQSAIFKGVNSISESNFQREVLRDLRIRLGQEVQEHGKQAGGFTDLKYRDVVIELKVEKDNGDRTYIAERYSKQSTQYQGVEARQISILLVLDLTEKISPPGDIRNDVLMVDVHTHGGSNHLKKYPSKGILFVVNGNIVSPSDYSR